MRNKIGPIAILACVCLCVGVLCVIVGKSDPTTDPDKIALMADGAFETPAIDLWYIQNCETDPWGHYVNPPERTRVRATILRDHDTFRDYITAVERDWGVSDDPEFREAVDRFIASGNPR